MNKIFFLSLFIFFCEHQLMGSSLEDQNCSHFEQQERIVHKKISHEELLQQIQADLEKQITEIQGTRFC